MTGVLKRLRHTSAGLCIALFAALLTVMAPPADAGLLPVPLPKVLGPVPFEPVGSASHNYPFGSALENLKAYGYVEQEFFFSGVAAGQPYVTRMVVRRPASAAKFSGTVVTEWANVSNLFDFDCAWSRSAAYMMRSGDAYVSISAQSVGVQEPKTGLKAFSPKRYGSLNIPTTGTFVAELGSYDIFSQALRAIKQPGVVRPLGKLVAKQQIATGCSQSAATLSIYAATVGSLQGLVDGYLIGELSTASIDLTPVGVVFPVPTPALLGVPVFQVNTETDEGPIRLEYDNPKYRLWEVAGTSHADSQSQAYTDRIAKRDLGIVQPTNYGCDLPALSRVPFGYVQNAALDHLKRWAAGGSAPPKLPQISYDPFGQVIRDADRNALGGIRLPEHAVPTATNNSVNSGTTVCAQLLGQHVPFSTARLRSLYPTSNAYLTKFATATNAAIAAGFLLPYDAKFSIQKAEAANVPG